MLHPLEPPLRTLSAPPARALGECWRSALTGSPARSEAVRGESAAWREAVRGGSAELAGAEAYEDGSEAGVEAGLGAGEVFAVEVGGEGGGAYA